MVLTHTHYQKHALQPLTTAHLAQTMTLLALNTQELRQKIESELAENPALEIVEERRCPTCNRRLPATGACPKCSFDNQVKAAEEPIVFVSPPEHNYTSGGTYNGEEITEEIYPAEKEDLPTFVLRQIAPDLTFEERPIAAHLLSSLDDDGLLMTTLAEVARYYHIGLAQVERVASLIQHADPIGVGAPSPKEALLVQVEVLGEVVPFPELTQKAISDGLDLLSRHHYGELAKLLDIPTKQAKAIAAFISENLNPFPGRAHWGNDRHQTDNTPKAYHKPDVIIRPMEHADDSRLIVEVLWPIAGTLRVNPLFKKAIKELSEEKGEQWKADIERANLLVKCLSQRSHTLVRLMQRLASLQREYILHGNAHSKPITRASLAVELDVHESTISRAVSGKSVQLPSGQIVPISQFFDRSLHIRTAIREIIDHESSPLSDTKIATILAEQGYKIARRTVAKYRSMEGIMPAHLRRARVAARANGSN
ncbi:MAG: hypothetical protein JXB38_07285 [Anaerolineales bacterium]|nr:hypothetical protein [Anaerolineales bacterium]